MEGEVVFLPHFARPVEESSNRREQERLQMQFLWDAWRYLNEDDEDKLEELEHELENPNHRRWQSWFDEAKKLKTRKQKARKKRLRRRRDEVEQALRQDPTCDIQLEDIEISGDTSEDDDSTYNSDADEDVMLRASEASHPKRKPVHGGNSGPSSKKSKKSGPGGNGGGFMGTPPMGSGGLGSADRDDSNRPQPNWNLAPSLTRSGASSSSSRSPGKRLPNTQRWRDDQESRQINGDLDDDEAMNSAIRASMGPDGEDPASNQNTQAE